MNNPRGGLQVLNTFRKGCAVTKTTQQELASAFYKAFVRKERNEPNEFGNKDFYSLADKSPSWMVDAIRDAHDAGGIFPNDWVYDACHSMISHMDDVEPENWDDSVSDWADGAVDVYNAERARWLASHLAFGGIVDDAVAELGHSDQGVYGDIGIGQYRFLEQIASALIAAVRAETENSDDDACAA